MIVEVGTAWDRPQAGGTNETTAKKYGLLPILLPLHGRYKIRLKLVPYTVHTLLSHKVDIFYKKTMRD